MMHAVGSSNILCKFPGFFYTEDGQSAEADRGRWTWMQPGWVWTTHWTSIDFHRINHYQKPNTCLWSFSALAVTVIYPRLVAVSYGEDKQGIAVQFPVRPEAVLFPAVPTLFNPPMQYNHTFTLITSLSTWTQFLQTCMYKQYFIPKRRHKPETLHGVETRSVQLNVFMTVHHELTIQ